MPILTTEDTAERMARLQQIIEDLLKEAKHQGASAAEASVGSSSGLDVAVRLGEVETVEHTRDNGLGITVYFGHRKGSASTSDLSTDAVRDTVRAACAIAEQTQEDRCAHLAAAELMATEIPDLDLYHPWLLSVEEAINLATACEDAARGHDPRIINSEGASLSTHFGIHVSGNSHGFIGGYPTTRHSLNCAVIAQEDDMMQRDYWWTSARSALDLEPAHSVGERAAARTVARLGARRLPTQEAPVLFRAEVATGLLRSLVGAINGNSLYRRSSFLLDHLGKRIFPEFVRIHEEPHLPRGLSSAPFDGDGVATRAKDLISGGVLQTYVLDTYSGCRLGLPTTGNAGGVRNLRIEMGDRDRAAMLRELGTGLMVTELMGHGVNAVTGDYSRGASGFWVENGEIQYPVEEITIAGNLKTMFAGLVAVGNDCDFPGGTRTGSWLIDRMTIAGE
ncbi:metalloprotease PmbA [Thiobaca trueperi]|uniref:Microcin-processing peptidase 1 n=1 Tax=Thiobaca trueperi TaxID=127458 RepID=A0A4R3MV08_9GAMM|nr:metalloprotease PmbA [Thiobaca trueperi]TCT19597.1 microcin-processing peptidase 1 [Thiobaca trueperi]